MRIEWIDAEIRLTLSRHQRQARDRLAEKNEPGDCMASTKRRAMKWIAALTTAFYIAGIVSAVHAVMSVRTPQGAIAWSVSLVSFPFISVPACADVWLGSKRYTPIGSIPRGSDLS